MDEECRERVAVGLDVTSGRRARVALDRSAERGDALGSRRRCGRPPHPLLYFGVVGQVEPDEREKGLGHAERRRGVEPSGELDLSAWCAARRRSSSGGSSLVSSPRSSRHESIAASFEPCGELHVGGVSPVCGRARGSR
jgi:hypothetical protein